LARPGENILAPNPSYPLFDPIAQMTGITLRHYPLVEENGWRVDLEQLKQATDAKTRAIILVSPHNPTGWVASREELEGMLDWCRERELPLIVDEVFSEFYFGKECFPRPIVESSPNLCFTLNGISKMFALPALKLGWILVTGERSRVDPIVDHLETTADTFLSVHTPIQETLPSLFREESFVSEYRAEVGRRRELAVQLLRRSPDIRFAEPQGGFYAMVRVQKPMQMTEEEFVIRLMEEKQLFVHPGYFFDYEKGTHFVISFLTKKEQLLQGLEKILEFISKGG
ncbi:MAG: pyridoxal phosphate-dependent aminotransferase, partial [Deltaproteobacteria bacterium]|nr:pyridoxal phosphate-dependent aminotransferase [Deltaproteobacteria bacterium]